MKHQELYSEDAHGNTRVWYMESDREFHRTVSGILGGNLVTTEWTEVHGKNYGKKNETTDEAQCIKDIESKYRKQLKTGYTEDIGNVGLTNYVEPMLAKNYRDYVGKINLRDYLVQTKYNGHRCIATKSGLFSRKGERYLCCPHIEEALKPFFSSHPNAVLDGELFNYEFRQQLNKLAQLVRKTKNITEQTLIESEKYVKFFVYDGYNLPGQEEFGENLSYIKRKATLNQIIRSYRYLERVEDFDIDDESDLYRLFEELVEDGQEGVMLRLKDGFYEHKRSKTLLKFKPEDDAEFEITFIEEGTGNWSGKAKRIGLKTFNGKCFKATFKGSMPEAEKCLREKKKWIGRIVTIRYFNLTGLGTPNSAQFDINNQGEIYE